MNTAPIDAQVCVIVHNHWIHYKDLLFRAMLLQRQPFLVLYTAASSSSRLAADGLAAAPYSYEISCRGAYEEVNQTRAAFRTWRALTRLRPSIVLIGGWCDGPAWAAWAWAVVHRVPMVLWAESNVFDRRRRWAFEAIKRIFVKRFASAHVYGRSNAEYLQQLGLPKSRILTKRAVLDVRHFVRDTRVQKDRDRVTLLYVGRFSLEKNLKELLLAMRDLQYQGMGERIRLVLVGYGPQEQRLRKLAGGLDCVSFRGAVDQKDLPSVYSGADVLVLPSRSEAWGLVVNEAMCCEIPVLVSNRCGCAADLVTPDTGWIFDIDDEESLSLKLREIAGCPKDRLAFMGRKARELAVVYSPENCATLVARSLGGLTAGKHKSYA